MSLGLGIKLGYDHSSRPDKSLPARAQPARLTRGMKMEIFWIIFLAVVAVLIVIVLMALTVSIVVSVVRQLKRG